MWLDESLSIEISLIKSILKSYSVDFTLDLFTLWLKNAIAYYFCLLVCIKNPRLMQFIEGTFVSEYNFRCLFTHF